MAPAPSCLGGRGEREVYRSLGRSEAGSRQQDRDYLYIERERDFFLFSLYVRREGENAAFHVNFLSCVLSVLLVDTRPSAIRIEAG